MGSSATEGLTIETMMIAMGDVRYEARLHYGDTTRPGRAAVIAPPHPFLGGNFDNNVVKALAGGLARAGIATLTYNLPGVGKSTARTSSAPQRETFWESNLSGEELGRDAWDYLRLRDYLLDLTQLEGADFIAAGYSYGGAVVWQAAGLGRIDALALISPPQALLEGLKSEERPGRALCIFAEDDLAFEGRGPAVVEGMARAVLGVHLLEGADHFFRDHLDAVCTKVLEHFEGADTAPPSPSSERS